MMAHSTKWFKLNIIISRLDLTLGAVQKLHNVDGVGWWVVSKSATSANSRLWYVISQPKRYYRWIDSQKTVRNALLNL